MINCENSLLFIIYFFFFFTILVTGVSKINFFQSQSTTCKWTTVAED